MTAPTRHGVVLAIDFGSRTTVGVLSDSGEPRLVGVDGQPWIRSAVYADEGGLVVGLDAVRLARIDPTRFEPSPKLRIDEGEVLLGTEVISIPQLVDAVIGRVVGEARRQLGSRSIDGLVLTHPAQWGGVRQGILRQIGERYAPSVVLLPEPVAAAMYFAATTGFPVGAALAVYDLGAGTFDTAVVRRDASGFQVLAFDGIPDLGGLDMDQRLYDDVAAKARERNPDAWDELMVGGGTDAESRRRIRSLRDDVSSAKETLSRRVDISIPLPSPFTDVYVTRADYEGLIRADLQRSVEVLRRTIAAAGQTPSSLHSIHLVGGATRTPLCAELIGDLLGVVPVPIDQPETVVALGAARALVPAVASAGDPPGTGQFPAPSTTGQFPLLTPTGGFSAPAVTGNFRSPPSSTGQFPTPAVTGQHPAVAGTGGYPAATASGAFAGPGAGRVAPPQAGVGGFGTSATGGMPTHHGAVDPRGPQTTSPARPAFQPLSNPPPPRSAAGPHVGPPTPQRSPGSGRSRLPIVIAAAIAVVGVVIAAVLVANLGSDSDPDNVAQPTTLNATQAITLLQKIIPKSYGAEGYELFDDGYSSSPNRSKTGFVCIPQDDAPLPAESGKVAALRLNLIETGGARDDRPRDQLLLSASYFTPDTASVILGEIRAKIKQCRDDAPTGSYDAYDYAEEVSDLDGDQVGMQTEMSSSPATVVTCQMTRIDVVILRVCAVTKKDDTREPRGLGGTPLPGPERSQTSADAAILDLVSKAKAALGK